MRPIPESIDHTDISWRADLLQLSEALVEIAVKPKLIKRYTPITQTELRALWKARHGTSLPAGVTGRQTVEYFINARNSHNMYGATWNVQGATFLTGAFCLRQSINYPVNRGWLLAQAFKAYEVMTRSLLVRGNITLLDANKAYSLLALSDQGLIGLHRCSCHQRHYLVDPKTSLARQPCPFSTMNKNHLHTREAGSKGNLIRWSAA